MVVIRTDGTKGIQLDWFHALSAIVGMLVGFLAGLAALDGRYVQRQSYSEDKAVTSAAVQHLADADLAMRNERMMQFSNVEARLRSIEDRTARIAAKLGVER